MRTIGQLAIPKDTDLVKFPDGTVLNETETVEGTPVVREVLGDVLTNVYKILRLTKETPDGLEDTEVTKYQLVNALKKWTNDLNDKEQVLTLAATVWSVPFDLDILPNKYVFIAIASDNFNPLIAYTFKGTGAAPIIGLTSATGFNASDEILVVIDTAGVRVISLTKVSAQADKEFTVFGQPLSYNSTSVIKYETNGKLLSDAPSIDDLRNTIRTLNADPLTEVFDMVILKGFVLCFCFLPGTTTYNFYHFDLIDLNTAIAVPVTGIIIPIGSDNKPFMYTDGTDIFVTNATGNTANDNDISKLTYTPATPTIAFVSTITINAGFVKTSNVVVKGGELFTFITSVLKKYNLSSGAQIIINDFETINGIIFQFNGFVFYTNGEVATKWII